MYVHVNSFDASKPLKVQYVDLKVGSKVLFVHSLNNMSCAVLAIPS